MEKSMMISIPPIYAAIGAFERKMGALCLTPINNQQRLFVEDLLPLYKGSTIPAEGIASFSRKEVLDFLRERGVAIDVPGSEVPGIKIAGFMEVNVEWLEAGISATIRTETPAGKVNALRLSDDIIHNMDVTGHPHIVTKIHTREPDTFIFVTLPDEKIKSEIELAAKIQDLSSAIRSWKSHFNGEWKDFALPSVDMDIQCELTELVGMGILKGQLMDYAVERNKLKVDEHGARASSGFYGGIVLGGSFEKEKEPLVIREPYLIWGEKGGNIYFSAFVHWKSWTTAKAKEEE